MAEHNLTGKKAEILAAEWLIDNGYEILHRNWRYSHYEIDIIARKNNLLTIIEVKSRKDYGEIRPEENVNKRKFRMLAKAADEFLFQNPEYKDLRFCVLAINLYTDRDPEFFLIEDVFM